MKRTIKEIKKVNGKLFIEISELELGLYEFICTKCNKIHTKSSYCIAQEAMGHEMFFTCDCGNQIKI